MEGRLDAVWEVRGVTVRVCLLDLQGNLVCQVCLSGPTPSVGPAWKEALFQGRRTPSLGYAERSDFSGASNAKGLGILVRWHLKFPSSLAGAEMDPRLLPIYRIMCLEKIPWPLNLSFPAVSKSNDVCSLPWGCLPGFGR